MARLEVQEPSTVRGVMLNRCANPVQAVMVNVNVAQPFRLTRRRHRFSHVLLPRRSV